MLNYLHTDHMNAAETDASWYVRVMEDRRFAKQVAATVRVHGPPSCWPKALFAAVVPPHRRRALRALTDPRHIAARRARATAKGVCAHTHRVLKQDVSITQQAAAHALQQKRQQERLAARRRERQWHPLRTGVGAEHVDASEQIALRPRPVISRRQAHTRVAAPRRQTKAEQTASVNRMSGDPDGTEGDAMRDWLREVRNRAGLAARARQPKEQQHQQQKQRQRRQKRQQQQQQRRQRARPATAPPSRMAQRKAEFVTATTGACDEFQHLNLIENSPNELLAAQAASLAQLGRRVRRACLAAGEEELLEPEWRKLKRRQRQRQAAELAAVQAGGIDIATSPVRTSGTREKAPRPCSAPPARKLVTTTTLHGGLGSSSKGRRAWMPAGVTGSPIAIAMV